MPLVTRASPVEAITEHATTKHEVALQLQPQRIAGAKGNGESAAPTGADAAGHIPGDNPDCNRDFNIDSSYFEATPTRFEGVYFHRLYDNLSGLSQPRSDSNPAPTRPQVASRRDDPDEGRDFFLFVLQLLANAQAAWVRSRDTSRLRRELIALLGMLGLDPLP